MLDVLAIALEQGFGYALLALGIMIPFRLLTFPDLTSEGSFPLGGAVCAALIVAGVTPVAGVAAAAASGALAGCLTGVLHTKCKINALLAGILVLTMLYSANLRIMGRSNIPLLDQRTLLTPLETLAATRVLPVIAFFGVLALVAKTLLDLFLHTQYGMALRATGDNEQMMRTYGVNTQGMTVAGLALANALNATAGALMAQDQGFADAGMGIGVLVTGLASIIVGEALVGRQTVFRLTLAVVVGSILYRGVVAVGLRIGLAPTDLKLATGVMVILVLSISGWRLPGAEKVAIRE